MPFSDYFNFNPAPEATGGYYTGGLGMTADEMAQSANSINFYNQANTIGITPFESQQLYNAATDPTKIYLGANSAAQLDPQGLAALNLVSSGQGSYLPANIFAGPVSNLGLAGAGANALYNLGTAGYNYLTGQGSMPLSSMTGGNLALSGGDLSLSSTGIPSNLSLATGMISPDPSLASQQAMSNAAWNASIGTPGWTPTVGQSQMSVPASGSVGLTSPEYTLPTLDVFGTQIGSNLSGTGSQSNIGQTGAGLDLGLGASGAAITPTPGVTVTGSNIQTANTAINTATSSTYRTGSIDTVNTAAPIVLPTFTAGTTPISSSAVSNQPATTYTQSLNTETGGPVLLPSFTVNTQRTQTSATNVPSSTYTQSYNLTSNTVQPTSIFSATTSTVTQTTVTSTSNMSTSTFDTATGISYNPNAGQVAAGTAQRDLAAELAKTIPALYGQYNLGGQQGTIMDQYMRMYQGLLGQTAIPQAAQQSLAQMQADAAKLQRIQQGQLSSEDIRQSQQAAREAYGARGQVMGPGAIGAEILNREAIRQQREDQARAAYQASMGNVFNAAQLQTGNIFSPIGNLVSGTFNPLGAYPQDVYSSNVNAQLARDIAAANNAAAIEAAKYGAAASQKAATTSALGNILGKIVPGIFG